MLSFYSLLLATHTLVAPPDTSYRPAPNQLVKLGLRAFSPGDLALSYERQLTERWSVLGSIGYMGYTWRGSTIFHDYDDTFIEDSYTTRERFYSADVQLRYYFRRRKLRPLAGWYTAANLHNSLRTSVERHSRYTNQNHDIARTSTNLQLLLGRQWGLGRRLTLDSYLGVNMQRRQSATVGGTRGVVLEGGWGLQVGYRFRPLPR